MSNADSLVAALDERPDDPKLREQAARALDAEKHPARAVTVLQQGFIHFNAHEPGMLPCLCRRCIVPDDATTTVGGSTFYRDFVVAGAAPKVRVLFFWIPEDLIAAGAKTPDSRQRRRLRRSVLAGLRNRIG